MIEINLRRDLIASGVRNLKEFGYPDATPENILTTKIFRLFFHRMLTDSKASIDSRPALDAIDALLKECDDLDSAPEPVEPAPAPAAIRIGANLSDLFFNTDASDCEAATDNLAGFAGYDADKLREHARLFLETFMRATMEWSGAYDGLNLPQLPPVPDELVDALVSDFIGRQ